MKITMSKHRNDAQPGAKRQVHPAHLLGMIVVAASVFTVGRVDAAIVPTDLSGVQLWLKADAGVTESSGVVTSWDDQSAWVATR
jgi:hypothetical protein